MRGGGDGGRSEVENVKWGAPEVAREMGGINDKLELNRNLYLGF